ncbi:MAG: LysE family transporter [Anaerolineae bacterium]
MPTNLFSLLAYVLISTFTPGPSNISSAATGVLYGYKNTLNYQGGLAVGVFLVMLCSGWISTTLLSLFPALEPTLRYIGAGYILYLAGGMLKASYHFTDKEVKPLGFLHGLALQLLNPKLFIYAFTVFTAFLAPLTAHGLLVALAALLLAAISFGATSVWAWGGTAIRAYLYQPRLTVTINVILSLFLVYAAIALVGVI